MGCDDRIKAVHLPVMFHEAAGGWVEAAATGHPVIDLSMQKFLVTHRLVVNLSCNRKIENGMAEHI